MPFKGGAADKIGNRYEAYFTISCIIDILREEANLIHIEPPGFEGEGVEFYLVRNGEKEYYQVKRQHYRGKWTINDLSNVLQNFFAKLEDLTVTCHFVSSSSATELEGLIDRADETYYEDFENNLKGPYLKAWETIIGLLNKYGSEESVYEALKRIKVELISEETLKKNLLSYLEPIVDGNPSDVRSWFFEYVFNQVGSKLTIDSIWNDLKAADYHPAEWYKDRHIIGSFDRINDRYLRRIKKAEFSLNPIFRECTNEILDNIESKQDLIITGSAGIGKSGIISQFLDELKSQRTPFFVLDLENNELAYSAKKLGLNMGLPGSPVNVLENIVQGKRCVFIIDQLDSLSVIQGKKLGFMDCIYELIEQVKNYPNMNLILVCRDFDLKNDKRLSNIKKIYEIHEIEIEPLTLEELKQFIENELNLDKSKFSELQFEILTIPLHLKLFVEIMGSGGSSLTFDSKIDLYNEYWDRKKRYIETKFGRSIGWDSVISLLCDYISENQDFKAPKFILDRYFSDAEIMASEGVLTSDSNSYGFFHGSFFDYSFARIFVRNKGSLLEFLLNDEQYLFKRSQVRQILTYKRSYKDTLFNDYLDDIESILNNPKVRFHIKILILELFSRLSDPTKEEWDLIEPFISDKENLLYGEAWRSIFRSIYWFELLDSMGIIESYLKSEDWDLITKTMWFLYGIMSSTERVAELLKPYVGKSRQWDELIIRYTTFTDLRVGNNFELLLLLIDEDIFENTRSFREREYWSVIETSVYKLAKTNPNRSIEIISHYLNRKIELTLNNAQTNPFSENSGQILTRSFEDKEFINLAEKSPKAFVNKILPLMLSLMEINADKKSQKPFKDEIWRYRGYKERRYQNREILLYSMETALRKLAVDFPKSFSKWEQILRTSNYETAHFLLIRSYSANGKKYSNKAVDYLEKNPQSLKIGYFSSSYWATRILIESICPHCLYSKFKKLEKMLLNYFNHQQAYYKWICTFYPGYCSDFGYYEYRNANVQLGLLEGIPLNLRSISVESRMGYLNKIFGVTSEKPTKMRTIAVTSPINEKEAKKLSDDEWLAAIAKYNEEVDMLEGGPLELSRELNKLVKDDPERFAKLTLRFPDDTNVYYFDAVLMGLADSEANLNSVIDVCKRCHELPSKPCGRWITQPIAKFAGEKLPKEALDIINYYVLNDPDPQEDLWNPKNFRGSLFGERIFESGINSARGIAALSLANLLFDDKDLIYLFYPTLKKIVNDPVISVRSCVAESLIGVLKHDPSLALDLFKELCNTDDILLQTRQIERFLYYNLKENFDSISEIIYRMIFSETKSVAIVGARIISYAYLIRKDLLEFYFCLNYSEFHRLGIAQVFSEYLAFSPLYMIKPILIKLFNDPSVDVRSEASNCFRKINNENINDYTDLVRAFIYSPAFIDNSGDLMYALDKIEILPDNILDVCEQFFIIAGSDASDITTETSGTAFIVSNLVFKLYGKTKEQKIKTKCLNLIDNMIIGDYEQVQNKLIEYER